MASANSNSIFRDGSNNKPSLFCGEHFGFWKIRMKTHLQSQGKDVWNVVLEVHFAPTTVVNGVGTPKPKASWDEDDEKKVIYDKKAINFIQGALGMDELFRISTCTMTKEI